MPNFGRHSVWIQMSFFHTADFYPISVYWYRYTPDLQVYMSTCCQIKLPSSVMLLGNDPSFDIVTFSNGLDTNVVRVI